MRLGEDEFTARRSAFAAALQERGLGGAVLFDTQYVHYYSGFFFIPTERPIASSIAAVASFEARVSTSVSVTPGRV